MKSIVLVTNLLLHDSILNLYITASFYRTHSPEMACVGLTYRECVEQFGMDGFASMYVPEKGMDRADMERLERNSDPCFVELRVHRTSGRVLGCTCCGPAAAELTNSMGMAITNGLTVADVAKSPHSYPSYGYMLYRVALSMALSNTWGILEACGPIGKGVSKTGRFVASAAVQCRSFFRLPRTKRNTRRLRQWQLDGASHVLLFNVTGKVVGSLQSATTIGIADGRCIHAISYLDVFQNSTLHDIVLAAATRPEAKEYMDWYQKKP